MTRMKLCGHNDGKNGFVPPQEYLKDKDYVESYIFSMKKTLVEKRKKADKLYNDIVRIQTNCPHINLNKHQDCNTGNYDRIDLYWTNYHCEDCGKRWQSEIEYVRGY